MIAVDLRELSQINIKSINFPYFGQSLLQRPSLLVYIAMGIVTIIAVIQIFDKQTIKLAQIKTDLVALEEKDKAISVYEEAKTSLDKFFETLPQGTADLGTAITAINEFATRYSIQIQSLTPENERSSELSNQLLISLSIIAQNYSALGFFIRDLETSKYNLRIESWQVSLRRMEARGHSLAEDPVGNISIQVAMRISTTIFKK